MNWKGYKLSFESELIGSPVWVVETVETCKCSSRCRVKFMEEILVTIYLMGTRYCRLVL